MSDLSVLINRLGTFFAGFTHSDPEIQASVNQVGNTLSTAATQVEAILPHLAEDAANAALEMIPGGLGKMAEPMVDALIDEVIKKLLAKKSTAGQQPGG